jgi:hypothetical protein
MRDKDFKMLMEAYTNVSKKKLINESSSETYYFAGEDEGTELPIEINGKHYKYSGEFKFEASQWTADEHDDYGYNGPSIGRYTSHGKAYPESIELEDVESVRITDESGDVVFEYGNTNSPQAQRQGVNKLGIDPNSVLQQVFDNFKKVFETDEHIHDEVKSKAEPPEWEP